MKKPVILSLIVYALFAGEETSQPAKCKYDQERTKQVQVIVDTFDSSPCTDYTEKREKIKHLLCTGADPNVYAIPDCLLGKKSLLSEVVQQDDLEMVRCCLEHGAETNPPYPRKPAQDAQSAAVLQLLVDYKADLTCATSSFKTLLLNAVTQGKPPEIIAFLCNAGLDTNEIQQGSISSAASLHNLFYMMGSNKHAMESAAILVWYGANPHLKSYYKESPLDIIQQKSPREAEIFRAVTTVLPQVREQHAKKYREKLTEYITAGPASIVMTYIPPKWESGCWTEITKRLPVKNTQTKQEKKPRKSWCHRFSWCRHNKNN